MRRRRADRIKPAEAAYRLYLSILLAIIVGAPIARAIVLWLAGVISAIPASPLAAIITGIAALLVLAGTHTGPARASLPQLDLVYVSAIPRWKLLASPVYGSIIIGCFAGAVLAGFLVAARMVAGVSDGLNDIALLVGGGALGVVGAGAMLVGQLSRSVRYAAAAMLVALAAAQLLLGPLADPWSSFAQMVTQQPGGGPHPMPDWYLLVTSLSAAAAVLLLVLPLAQRLRREHLRAQAILHDTVRVLAVSGDASAAVARLGTPVRWGRSLRLGVGQSARPRFLVIRRDALGVLRTPLRSLLAWLGVAAAGALWVWAVMPVFAESPVPGVTAEGSASLVRASLLGAAAALVMATSVQPWCRGLQSAAAASGSPPLLPDSPVALLARHLAVPLALTLVAGACGALGVMFTGVPSPARQFGALLGDAAAGSFLATLASLFVLVVATVGLRLVAALKGPLPLKLLAPVPTPAGDLAGVNVFLWSLDGPVAAALSGAVLGAVWGATLAGTLAPVAAVLLSVALAALVVLWVAVRLRV